jgi:CheY-like chemotaxis protein
MEQVILNLAVNARDAMPAGGQLTIQTQNLTLAEDAYYGNISLKAGQYVLLKVQDTGIGITKEAQKHIFEPFYTTKAHGTGLGLSTTYGIVQQSGGKIGLQSQVDKGTSILICLPSVAESASESDVKMPKRHASIGAETILLVEDEDAVRLILTRALQRLGYTLLTACNAEEALNLYQHHPNPSDIDVLITDIMMNGMSGTALAAQLRPQNPNLYVVYMSGYTDTEFNSDTMPLDDRAIFLEKPFTPQTLHQMLQDLLQKK